MTTVTQEIRAIASITIPPISLAQSLSPGEAQKPANNPTEQKIGTLYETSSFPKLQTLT